MRKNIEQNCFQRDSHLLQDKRVRIQVTDLYQASQLILSHQYQQALQIIDEDNFQNSEEDERIFYQLKLMEVFCLYMLDRARQANQAALKLQKQLSEEHPSRIQSSISSNNQSIQIREIKRSLSTRFYTLLITMALKGYEIQLDDRQILRKLVKILKLDQFLYLPEVLGTISGCRNFKQVEKIKELGGPNSKRKAMKMEVFSIWKYLADRKQESLKMKKEAILVWTAENCLNQKQKCERQYNQLLNFTQNSQNPKTPFTKTLKRLYFFVSQLRKFQDKIQAKMIRESIKWTIPINITYIEEPLAVKKVQKNLTESKFNKIEQKTQYLSQMTQDIKQFYQNYKKQKNGQITKLIFNSQFVNDHEKLLTKKLMLFTVLKNKFQKTLLQQSIQNIKIRAKMINNKSKLK